MESFGRELHRGSATLKFQHGPNQNAKMKERQRRQRQSYVYLSVLYK